MANLLGQNQRRWRKRQNRQGQGTRSFPVGPEREDVTPRLVREWLGRFQGGGKMCGGFEDVACGRIPRCLDGGPRLVPLGDTVRDRVGSQRHRAADAHGATGRSRPRSPRLTRVTRGMAKQWACVVQNLRCECAVVQSQASSKRFPEAAQRKHSRKMQIQGP